MGKRDAGRVLVSGEFCSENSSRIFLDLIKIQTVNSVFDLYFNAEKIEVPIWGTFVWSHFLEFGNKSFTNACWLNEECDSIIFIPKLQKLASNEHTPNQTLSRLTEYIVLKELWASVIVVGLKGLLGHLTIHGVSLKFRYSLEWCQGLWSMQTFYLYKVLTWLVHQSQSFNLLLSRGYVRK